MVAARSHHPSLPTCNLLVDARAFNALHLMVVGFPVLQDREILAAESAWPPVMRMVMIAANMVRAEVDTHPRIAPPPHLPCRRTLHTLNRRSAPLRITPNHIRDDHAHGVTAANPGTQPATMPTHPTTNKTSTATAVTTGHALLTDTPQLVQLRAGNNAAISAAFLEQPL